MDELKNKHFITHDYRSRYTPSPVYYNEKYNTEVMGVGLNIKKDSSYILHKVVSTDTLEKLALTYYSNPTYWWVIAQFNCIFNLFDQLSDHYKTLKIPSISSISFGVER